MKYALILNRMTSSNIENIEFVPYSPISEDRNYVVNWYKNQLCDPWSDDRWGKSFRKDSPLEWFNQGNIEKDNEFFGGIYSFFDEISEEEIRNFRLFKSY